MKHSIRQRVLDPVTGLKVTKIETVNGELGSGIFDKNGREIFEGDKVLDANGNLSTVTWDGGGLFAPETFCEGLGCHVEGFFEIVGHVDD